MSQSFVCVIEREKKKKKRSSQLKEEKEKFNNTAHKTINK
jgi:hypothetical protein